MGLNPTEFDRTAAINKVIFVANCLQNLPTQFLCPIYNVSCILGRQVLLNADIWVKLLTFFCIFFFFIVIASFYSFS